MRSVFSTKSTYRAGAFFSTTIISSKLGRPACFAVSASSNVRTIETALCVAYSSKSFFCAGMENPSFPCSFEETLAYATPSR